MKTIILISALLLAGCTEVRLETSVEREGRLDKFAVEKLPNGANKVLDLGNDWYVFELETDGKGRKFLYHFHAVGDMPTNTTESLTELSP